MILFIFVQLALADSLFNNGFYHLARIEYERAIYFYPELGREWQTRLNLANATIEVDELKGVDAFDKLINDFPEYADEARMNLARHYLKTDRYYIASSILAQARDKRTLGFSYLFDGDPRRAMECFARSGDEQLVREIKAYLRTPEKSARTAALLSSIIPGSGELYAGNPKQAVIDFLVNLGSCLLLYNALHQEKFVDAGLIFTFLFQRFYSGSIYQATKSARNWNEDRCKRWLERIKKLYLAQ